MNRPNFFIIGAPKCGTTSVVHWLSEHPQIFIPRFKEPHFFNIDHNFINTPGWKHYQTLFRTVGPDHQAIGEASVWYLYSQRAVPEIIRHFPYPRFIVLLRNPVDMAYSLFEQQRYSGMEHLPDFETAWKAQEERRRGKNISSFCREPKHLLYGQACRLGGQLERLYSHVSPKQVLVIILDDLRQGPRAEYLRILEFLDLADDGRQDFPVLNRAKARRLPVLTRIIGGLNRFKNRVGIWNKGLGILAALDRLNTRYRCRPQMPDDLRDELEDYFYEEVRKLEILLKRDFSYWL